MVIPFKNRTIEALEYIEQRLISAYGSLYGHELQFARNELQAYIFTGMFPTQGFNKYVNLADVDLNKDIARSNAFLHPMYEGTIERFYALFTHTIEMIQIKPNYTPCVKFDCLLPLKNLPTVLQDRFGSYHIWKVEDAEIPFRIESNERPVVVIKPTDNQQQVTDNLSIAIDKVFKKECTYGLANRCSNLNVDVICIDNPFFDQQSYTHIGKMLADRCTVKSVDVGHTNKEWTLPNARYTLFDESTSIEAYISVYAVPLPSIRDMLKSRAKTILENVRSANQSFQSEIQYFITKLTDDLSFVIDNLESVQCHELNMLDEFRYTQKNNKAFIDSIAQEFKFTQFSKEQFSSLLSVYSLVKSYNHYAECQKSVNPKESLKKYISKTLQTFGDNKDVYLLKNYDPKNKSKLTYSFKDEKEMTRAFSFCFSNREGCAVEAEVPVNTGIVDVQIQCVNFDIPKAMLEFKLIKEKDTKFEIYDKFESAVNQIETYTYHNDYQGFLIFLTLNRHEDQVAEIIRSKFGDLGFRKIRNGQFKFDYEFEQGGKVYPIRFMKLKSNSPSDRKDFKNSTLALKR